MSDIVKLAQALDYAARKHTGQKRKGEKEEPYINHLAEVARLVAEATGGRDANLVIACLLHDVIEDQKVPHAELVERFGSDVADLVGEVTDDKNLSKAERKRLQVEHASGKSDRARMLKLADKTSNLRALVSSPPADWSGKRKRQYFAWAREVATGLRGVNASLDAVFDEAYEQGVRTGIASRDEVWDINAAEIA